MLKFYYVIVQNHLYSFHCFRLQKEARNKQNAMTNGEIKDVTNNVEQLNNTQENGSTEDETGVVPSSRNESKKKKKSKSKQRDKQLLKKEARMLREKVMSEGLEPFNFSSLVFHDQSGKNSSPLENGNSQIEQTSSNCSQKRTSKSILDGNKAKRRKSMQTA